MLTVLIGRNNSGKTSFLNALFAAIGAGQRIISNDDILLRKGEVSARRPAGWLERIRGRERQASIRAEAFM